MLIDTTSILLTKKFDRLLYWLILLLIVSGTLFTKTAIAGPLFLHDLCLLICVCLSLLTFQTKWHFAHIVYVWLISLGYLVFSLLIREVSTEIIFRQYAIFGYMFLYYLIFNRTIGTTDNLQHIRFLKFTGWLSLSLQGAFAVFVTIKGRNVFDGYNYYSPAVVLGVIIAAAAFVTSSLTFTQRFIGVLACLVLAMTTGHASAFLGVIMVLLTYLFLLTNNKSRLIIAGAGLLLLISFYLVLPQFSDANAGWRLLTWNHFLYKSIIDNYALIGNGFGVPYFDNEIVSKLFKDLGAVGFFSLETPMERWLSTAHNSFITIFFAIGFIPGLLIFYPLVGAVRYALNRKNVKNPDTDFLLISFIGTSVWCAMNVVLELPHSAGYYWLIYFTFCNQIGRGFDRRAESMNVS